MNAKIKTMKPLDLNSGWDDVVNPVTAKNREQAGLKVRRWLLMIVVLLAAIFLNLMLWVANVVPAMASITISGVCGCVTCFVAGRLYEVVSR